MNSRTPISARKSGYAPVNGLKLYYEIEGDGAPLVYIPPAFGHAGLKSFPPLAENHAVITVDLQGHGRTADIPERPLSIEQNASDVVALLAWLGLPKADFFGESYGASTAVVIAIKYPEAVRRVVAYGGTYGPAQIAHNTAMLRFDLPPAADGRSHAFQRDEYKKVAPDPNYWPQIWEKVARMRWDGLPADQLASIKSPVLIIVGDHDFVRVEHAAEAFRHIPLGELAVIPDASHFALASEQEKVIPIIQQFLEKPSLRLPLATSEMGDRPGETR